MREILAPLLLLQRFIVPAILVMFVWSIWRTVFKKDTTVGLALYASLLVLVDAFYDTGLYIPGFAVGSIKYSEICALFLLFDRPPAPRAMPVRRVVLFLVGAYFGLMAFAAVRAQPMFAGIADFRQTLFPQIVAFALALRGFRSVDEYHRFLRFFGVLILIVVVFCFWDAMFDTAVLHSQMLDKPEYYMNHRNRRFGSVFLNPNFLGAFVVLMFPVMFMLALHESRRARIYMVIVLLGLIFCLVETQSRAPLLGFAAELVILVLGPSEKVSRLRRLGGLAVGLILLTLAMPGFYERATDRFGSIEAEVKTDEVSRASVWVYTQKLIADHPVLGIGLGESQFLAAMDKTDFEARFGRRSLDNPHNSYLEAAVFAGIPSLVLFALANLVLLAKAFLASLRSATTSPETHLTLGIAAGIGGFLISIYPDMQLFTQHVGALYWMFFALLLSLVSRQNSIPAASTGAAQPAVERRRAGPGTRNGPLPLPTGARH